MMIDSRITFILGIAVGVWSVCGHPVSAQSAVSPEPVRMAVEVFGESAEIEVRDLPGDVARKLVREALGEVYEVATLLDLRANSSIGGIAALNANAGRGFQVVEPRVGELLVRSLQFCVWSSNAFGPLGGHLYRLWDQSELPDPVELRDAVESATCKHLNLAAQSSAYQASLDIHSQIDLRAVAKGYAIDRAIQYLRTAGVSNAWVGIGDISRAIGNGVEGRGWFIELASGSTETGHRDSIFLHDQAVAILKLEDRRKALVDHRFGLPPRGVQLVVAVTELAIEAEALASVMMVTGLQGKQLLGALEPRPSVLWVLGSDESAGLKSMYRWSELDRLRTR